MFLVTLSFDIDPFSLPPKHTYTIYEIAPDFWMGTLLVLFFSGFWKDPN